VLSGEIIAIDGERLGHRNLKVRISHVSGHLPDEVVETISMTEREYRAGRAETWQHMPNLTTPFEILRQRVKESKRKAYRAGRRKAAAKSSP
jgi:hypothetical protein